MNSLLPSICNHDQTTRRWKAKRERISNLDQGSGRKDRRASSSCRHHPLRSMKSNPYRFLLTSKTTGKQIRICIKLYSIEMRRRKKNILLIRWSNPSRLKTQQYLTSKRKSEEEVVSKKLEAFIAPVFFIYWWGKRNQETDHSFFLIGNRSCGRCTNKKRLCISSYIFSSSSHGEDRSSADRRETRRLISCTSMKTKREQNQNNIQQILQPHKD